MPGNRLLYRSDRVLLDVVQLCSSPPLSSLNVDLHVPGSTWMNILKGLLEVVGGIIAGLILGLFLCLFPSKDQVCHRSSRCSWKMSYWISSSTKKKLY